MTSAVPCTVPCTVPVAPAREIYGLPPAYWALWLSILVNRVATFVQPFLVLFLVHERGMSLTQAGLVATVLGSGAVVSSVLGGWLGDRIDRRRAVVVGDVCAAVSLVALACAPTTQLVWVAALAVGLSSDLARPAFGALVADVVRPQLRVRAYSLNFWAINLGFSVATVSAGALSRWGIGPLFVVDAAATLVSALVVVLAVPGASRAPVREPGAQGVVRAIVRNPRALALVGAATAYAVVYQQAYSTLPLVMGRDGLSPAEYGAVVAVNGVVIVLLQPLAAHVLERLPHDVVYATFLVVVAAGFGSTALASSVTGHVAAVVVWSVGEVGCQAVAGALFVALAAPHQRAGFVAAFSMTFSAGMALGPALGTWVLSAVGEPVLWWGSAALLAGSTLPVVLLRGRAPQTP